MASVKAWRGWAPTIVTVVLEPVDPRRKDGVSSSLKAWSASAFAASIFGTTALVFQVAKTLLASKPGTELTIPLKRESVA